MTGEYPGDGKPKPVAFPDPADVEVGIDGITYVSLPKLIEPKLASGMTNSERLRDLAEVQELIRSLALSDEFGGQLYPFTQSKFCELASGVKDSVTREPS